MTIIAIMERTRGNAEVGEMTLITKVFNENASVKEVIEWSKNNSITGRLFLTQGDEA